MAATGTVTISIVGDAAKLRSALGEAEGGLASFSTKMQSLGDSLTRFGARMSIGVTLPLALLGKQAFDAASDLNESLSKVNVVFAENAGAIKKWSQDSAASMGISRQAALEAAGTFGNLFRALGVGIEPATDMSKKLVQLASDLASFNNADPAEVLIALRAGLVGEQEPLRKFGVSLSQARIEAKALEMGLWDGIEPIDASSKAQAAYAIILEDTTLAQGDFARTADGAANKQRTLAAEFENTKAKLGQALLPIFQQLAEALSNVAAWFSNLSPEVQKFAVYAAIALAAIGPLATALGGLATIIGILATPIIAIGLAIGALVAAAVLLYLKWDEVWNAVAQHPALLAILAPLGAILLPIIALVGAVKLVQANWETIWPALQALVEGVKRALDPVFDALGDGLHAVGEAGKWLRDRWQEAWPTIQAILEGAWSVIRPILEETIPAALQVVQFVAGQLQGAWEEVWAGVSSAVDIAWSVVQPILKAFGLALDVVQFVGGLMRGGLEAAFNGVVSGAAVLWNAVDGPLRALLGILQGIYNTAKKVLDILPGIPGVGGGIGNVGEIVGMPGNGNYQLPGDASLPYGGGHAMGGSVLAGTAYLVGERGPELFMSGRSGTIVPNHALGGNSYTISVQVAPGGSPADTGRAIVESIKEFERRAGSSWRN